MTRFARQSTWYRYPGHGATVLVQSHSWVFDDETGESLGMVTARPGLMWNFNVAGWGPDGLVHLGPAHSIVHCMDMLRLQLVKLSEADQQEEEDYE